MDRVTVSSFRCFFRLDLALVAFLVYGSSAVTFAAEPAARGPIPDGQEWEDWSRIQQARKAWSSDFEQSRYTKLRKVPTRQSGRMIHSPEFGLWVEYPSLDRALLISSNEVRYLKEGQEQDVDDAGLAVVLEAINHVLSGELSPLGGSFDIDLDGDPAANWTLRLDPVTEEIEARSILIEGKAELPEEIDVDFGHGKELVFELRNQRSIDPPTRKEWEEITGLRKSP